MTNHDQFDELLDHALTEYRDAEPLSGLEDRVLQRLQTQPVDRRRTWWMWGAIATCAALVLVGVWVHVENHTTPHLLTDGKYGPPTQPLQACEQVSPSVSSSENKEFVRVTERPTRPREGRMGHPANTTITTQSAFPMPTPLTAQERAFMASLQGNSTAAANDQDPDSFIAIAEIQIKPLAVSGQSSGGDQ